MHRLGLPARAVSFYKKLFIAICEMNNQKTLFTPERPTIGSRYGAHQKFTVSIDLN